MRCFVLLLAISCLCNAYAVHLDLLQPLKGDTDDVLYFWHITDPHLDTNYTIGSNPNCGIPNCCHSFAGLNESSPRAGTFGYRQPGFESLCDVPTTVFQSALEFMKQYPVKPIFVHYGGDNLSHEDWIYTRELNLQYMRLVHDMMKTTLGKEIPVLSAIGNHDAYPIDQFDTPPGNKWFLEPYGDELSYWLSEDIVKELKYAGYYTYPIRKGLRAIVLNTQYYDKFNFYLYKNATEVDYAGQIAWLQAQLEKASQAGEKVFILAHIPPEGPLHVQINMYERIYRNYSKIIITHLYGHHHCDYFQAYSDPDNTDVATGVGFIGPVITTYTSSNPAVSLFKMNATTFELIDKVAFWVNITDANIKGSMEWKLLYTAKADFGLKDMSPTSWLNYAKELRTNDAKWAQFDALFNTMGEPNCGMKDPDCRRETICKLSWMTPQQQKACKHK